jgi:hypothetical protein
MNIIIYFYTTGRRTNPQYAACTDAMLEQETTRTFVRAPGAVRRRNTVTAGTLKERRHTAAADDAVDRELNTPVSFIVHFFILKIGITGMRWCVL